MDGGGAVTALVVAYEAQSVSGRLGWWEWLRGPRCSLATVSAVASDVLAIGGINNKGNSRRLLLDPLGNNLITELGDRDPGPHPLPLPNGKTEIMPETE